MQVHKPITLHEALTLLAERDGAITPVAGGTDLLVCWYHADHEDDQLLDLSGLRAELQALKLTEDELEIGGLTTYWDLIDSPAAAEFPLLAQAARQVGAMQIQTRGTWAGNIANGSPAADGVMALMAYDAIVILKSRGGIMQVALDQFFSGYKQSLQQPDQLIVGIRVPRRMRQQEWFYKVGQRSAQAISKVGVALVQDECGWRVVANSVAPFVCRCRTLENALNAGKSFQSPAEIRQILSSDVAPIDDIRSTAKYRATVLSRLLYYWLAENA
ncbi:MAG: FAD binding domain-containing protein [Planctomycetota bacterium]